MNLIYLIDLANLTIPMIIFLAIASLVFGILIGYLINSKYKNQVVELERERAKLTSQVSSLESELEESRLARSNADGEISLLTNRVRDREARLKETEGKIAIFQKKLEESQQKTTKATEVKSSKSLDVETTFIERQDLAKKTTSPLKIAKKTEVVSDSSTAKVSQPSKKSNSTASKASKVEEKTKQKTKKVTGKSAKKTSTSKSKATKAVDSTKPKKAASDKKTVAKRGRPKGSTNKNTKVETAVKSTKGRGRPAGSKNKTTKTASAAKPLVKKVTAKKETPTKKISTGRGRPKGSPNKVKSKVETTKAKTTAISSTKGRGRPKGSLNKKTATKKVASAVTRNKTTETRGRKRDDLKLIEGIGPKMEEALRNNGIRTFAKISKTTPEKLKSVLVKANPRYAMAATDSWPKQAKLAAEGQFAKLKTLTDSLNRGK